MTASQPPPRRAPEPIRRSWIVPLSWLMVGLVALLIVVLRLIDRARAPAPAAPATDAATAPAPGR